MIHAHDTILFYLDMNSCCLCFSQRSLLLLVTGMRHFSPVLLVSRAETEHQITVDLECSFPMLC